MYVLAQAECYLSQVCLQQLALANGNKVTDQNGVTHIVPNYRWWEWKTLGCKAAYKPYAKTRCLVLSCTISIITVHDEGPPEV